MSKIFRWPVMGTEVALAAAEGSEPGNISITAYNGGKLSVGFQYPVVLDLKGVRAGGLVPFLIDHVNAASNVLGQGTVSVVSNTLVANGKVTGSGALAAEIVQNSKNGHVYQASIGARPLKSTLIEAGETEKVNGRTFEGPFILASESEIVEVSVVAVGADREGTDFNIAATFGLDVGKPTNSNGGKGMNKDFVKWIAATLGMNETEFTALTEDQKSKIEAQHKASLVVVPEPKKSSVAPVADNSEITAKLEAIQEELRVEKINAACGDMTDLAAKAVSEKWSVEQVKASIGEIEKIRAARPAAPGVIIGTTGAAGAKVLEAGFALTYSNMSDTKLVAAYGADVVEAGRKYRGVTLKELIAAACQQDGVTVPTLGAKAVDWVRAAYSTRTFPSILSNVANKVLMESYTARESVAAMVSKKMSAADFKIHTAVRLVAGGGMKKIVNGDELEYGTMEDESRTYAIDTYGELLGLSRQDLINDDAGAFQSIPQQAGFDAWQTREELFWTLVLANTGSFFSAGNGNYIEGAGTVLGLAGLAEGVTAFEKFTDAKGRAIAVTPETLLVPSELKITADNFYSAERLITGTGGATTDLNSFRSKYRPLSTPFLSNATLSGYSATAWYLFANPAVLPAFMIAYLNGNEAPVIEESEPDARYLGRVFRIYFDVGVAQGDTKGALKSKGAV